MGRLRQKDKEGRGPVRAPRARKPADFQAMFDHASIGVALSTLSGVLLRTNPAFQNMVGYLDVEFRRMNLADIILPEDREETQRKLKEIESGRLDAFYVENRYRRKDGGIVWGRVAVCVVRGSEGKPGHLVAMVEDISQRKRAEEALQALLGELEGRVGERTRELLETNRKLEAEVSRRREAQLDRERLLKSEQEARAEAETASRAKDEFLAILSHELRTPLTAVLGWTWMLRTKKMEEAEFQSVLAILERNMKQQSQIVEDLLDISKIVAGTLELDSRSFDLGPVITASVEGIAPAASARAVSVRVELPKEPLWVSGDPARLQQAVWNLLSNGVKFSSKGGSVAVTLSRGASGIELRVRDAGSGIEPQFLPFVFERFSQGERAMTREHGGLGLGLALVRHIVEMHGGSVEAKSAGKGTGAEFLVRLPAGAVPG